MKPVKKILVPLDFSPHSSEALRVAADMARRYEASLDLLYVYQPMGYSLPVGFVLPSPETLTDLFSKFETLLAAAKADALAVGAPRAETTFLQGAVLSEILRFTKDHEVDLVVMGTHGRTGIKHVLIGSVAENMVRLSPCPVLTVRAAA